MKERSVFQRMLSFILAVLIAVPSGFGNVGIAFATETGDDDTVVEELVVLNDGEISLDLNWQDSEFKNDTSFNLQEYDNSTNAVKMKVSYTSQKIREEGYKAGELIITVKGISNVNRAGAFEAVTGADKANAPAKTRDWSYTWNKNSDTYTFTNNNPIAGNSVFSGYFELVWNVNARSSIHGYTQDDIKASLYIPDADTITSKTLSFTNETKCDEFEIDIEREVLYSANGIDGGLKNENYVFIKYSLNPNTNYKSRGLVNKSETFMFDSDYTDVGEGGIITHSSKGLEYTSIGDGKYNVTLKANETAGGQYVVVAYDRETYVNQELTAYLDWYGKFLEGDDTGSMDSVFLSKDDIVFTVPPDFDFGDSGSDLHELKTSGHEQKAFEDKNYAENIARKGGHIPGSKIKNGTTEQFYLAFCKDVVGNKYPAIDLTDDFIYITQNNGDYRQLTSKDYEMESVIITSTDIISNENDMPIKSGVYPVTVYANQNDELIKIWEYGNYDRKIESASNMTEEQVVTDVNETVWANTIAPIRTAPTVNAEMIDYLEWTDSITRIGVIENYGWSIVQVDKDTIGYVYSEYLETTQTEKPDTFVWQGFWMDYEQFVELPDGTTTVTIRYENVVEAAYPSWNNPKKPGSKDYIKEPTAIINVRFQLNEDGLPEEEQMNGVDGQVVNTSFISRSINGEYYARKDPNSYFDDDINIDLAQKDLDLYGTYVDREKGSITFYGAERSDYKSFTDIGDLTGSGTKFYTTLKIGGEFAFSEEEYPDKFSLYTILEDGITLNGYKIPESIWDIMTLEGFDLSAGKLANACTPEIIENYNNSGRTYIALHFDFTDVEIPHSGKISATFNLKVAEKKAKSSGKFSARSAIIIDKDIYGYPNAKAPDDGKWSDIATLWNDIDRDSNTEELLARSYDHTAYSYADSSHFQITKYVETTYSNGWEQLPEVPYEEYGGMYRYKISVKNGNSTANNIVVMDILETGHNMQWQGTFQSVDLSECETLGLTGTIYYSSKENPSTDLNSGDWSTAQGELVKAIAVDFGDSVLDENKELAVIVNMKAPNDTSLKEHITENGALVSLNMYDKATGNETKQDSLATNFVQVKLTPPLRSIIITKVDEVDYTRLSGAKFELYNKETGEKLKEATSNAMGYVVFNDLPADGTTYVAKEVAPPYGYKLNSEEIEVLLDANNKYLTVTNAREEGKVEVYKVNNLDTTMPVEGAEYTIYNIDGIEWLAEYEAGKEYENFLSELQMEELIDKSLIQIETTDVNGLAIFNNMDWHKYLIIESYPPEGYALNDTLYFVEVNRENVYESQIINTVDVQSEVKIQLNKYVSKIDGATTTEPLSGAIFELVKGTGNSGTRVGLYVTDDNGQIILSEIPYGNYFFREYRAPIGYNKAENVEFKLTPVNNDINVTVYNQRKAGKIVVVKKDNRGEMLKDIEFSLYDDTKKKVVAKVKTDDFGVAEISNLEWGTYYLVETDAPKYYQMDEQWQEIVIGKNTLEWNIERVNETVKGGVRLNKTNEAGDVYLPNAEYTLYTADGAVVGTYVTNENGQLLVENLEWGSYYFKETKAPLGYGLSSETIRFSVNYMNAGTIQEIEATDPLDSKTIKLTKKIKAEDINFANGNPSFLFKVEGNDAYGNTHTYYNIVVFDEEYVQKYTDSDGYVSQQILFTEIVAGYYQATEEKISRYQLVGITDTVNTIGDINEGVTFDLVNNNEASATFVNKKYENQAYSDTQTITNVLKAQKKLVGIKATYNSDIVQAQSIVDYSLLKVFAIYDDGSTKELGEKEFALSLDEYELNDGSKVQRFPNKNGTYTVVATHMDLDTGITKKGNFTVTIEGQTAVVVSLNTTSEFVGMGRELKPKDFEVTATYNDGTTAILSPDEYIISPNVAPDYEGDLEITISLNLDIVPNEGRKVSTTTIAMVAEVPTLIGGRNFSTLIPSGVKNVIFTDIPIPSGVKTTDVSVARNGGLLAWVEDDTFYVSNGKKGLPILANQNCGDLFFCKGELYKIDMSIVDTSNVTNMSYMFFRCYNLTELDISNFDTSNVTNMALMFGECYSFTKLDLSNFNTSKVTSMHQMFHLCKNLTELDISSFDTSNVTAMSAMFQECSKLREVDLSSFNTSNVTNMNRMFYSCGGLKELDLSNFDTSSATNMSEMFAHSAGLKKLDLTSFDTSNVTNMDFMFYCCSGLTELDVSSFDVSNATNMHRMFYRCSSLTKLDVSNFEPNSAIKISEMFGECSNLIKLDLSNFHTPNATNMAGIFRLCSKLTELDVSGFDTSNVSDMNSMFDQCYSLTELDLSNFDTSNVTNMNAMFSGCSNLTTIYASNLWSTANVTSSTNMFSGCSKLVGGAGTKFSSSYKDKTRAKIDGGVGNEGYLSTPIIFNYVVDLENNRNIAIPEIISSDPNLEFTINGYEVIEGAEYVSLNKETGEITSIGTGKSTIAVSITTSDGIEYTAYEFIYSLANGVYAVHYAENNLLRFYNTQMNDNLIIVDTVKSVYTGFDTATYTGASQVPWYSVRQIIKSVEFADEVGPISTAYWFYEMSVCTSMDLAKLNTSDVTNMRYMFRVCTGLTELDLSSFDTKNVTTMEFMFGGCTGLTELDLSSFDTRNVTHIGDMFNGCSSLKHIDLSSFDTSNVKYMNYVFYNCKSLMELDVSNFNTDKVTNTAGMFNSCANLTKLDLSSFDTSKVTEMQYMFAYCYNLKTIYVSDLWSTARASNSAYMFTNCMSLVGGAGTIFNSTKIDKTYAKIDGGSGAEGYFSQLSLSYDLKSVPIGKRANPIITASEGLDYTILGYEVVSGNEYVSINRKTGTVTGNAEGTATIKMTAQLPNEKTITAFATVHVGPVAVAVYSEDDNSLTFYKTEENIETGNIFNGKTATTVYNEFDSVNYISYYQVPWYIDGNYSKIKSVDFKDEVSPISTPYWFYDMQNCTSMNLEELDTSNVTDMSYMFYNCTGLTELDMSSFNTSNVTNMMYMFYNCTGLTELDMSSFNTSNVTNMEYMFYNCTGLTKLDIRSFNTSNVKNMSYMFRSCESLTELDLSNFNTSKVTTMDRMFSNCSSLTELDLSSFNTFNVTNMSAMFNNCDLEELDLSSFDTSNVTNMTYMFYGCSSLTELNLSSFNTNKVADMQFMFYNCASLTELDVSNLDTSKVSNMNAMFSYCKKLEKLDLSNFNTSNLRSMKEMFRDCHQLTELNISSFNTSNITNMDYLFCNNSSLTTIYVSELWSTAKVTGSFYMFMNCKKLVGGADTTYNSSYIDKTYAKVDGGTANPGYLTHINDKPVYE